MTMYASETCASSREMNKGWNVGKDERCEGYMWE